LADKNNEHYSEDLQQQVLKHNNTTPQHIQQVLDHPDDYNNTIRKLAIEHPNASAEQLHTVLDKELDSGTERNIEAILDHPHANAEHARKVLHGYSDPSGNLARSIFDNKHNLTPEDIDFALKQDDPTMHQYAIKHHAATRQQVDSLANSPNHRVQEAVKEVYENRFPKTENPVNVKLGTHPLRQLRDFVDSKGGVMKKQDFKAAGVNTAAIDKLFGPKGTITSQDIQNHIDQVPATSYNSSISSWDGGQRHSGEKQNVFQLNYTEDQLKQMQDAGVLGTFRRLQDHTFSSGHPVKRNTLVGFDLRVNQKKDSI